MPNNQTHEDRIAARRPSWNADDLYEKLRRYDRTPFLELLSYWLECAPTFEEISAFAKKKPDLWVKALTDLARISGFIDKQETIHTFRLDQLSDSQLEDRARALALQFNLPEPKLINAIPDRSPTSDQT